MATKTDIWMPLYIADYITGTSHLHPHEHGPYLLLLMHMWMHRGDLPNDDERLQAITGMTKGSWKKARSVLRAFFYVSEHGSLRHKRIDSELERAQANVNQRSEAGKASAAKRKAEREAEPQQLSNMGMLAKDAEMMESHTMEVASAATTDATEYATNDATDFQREVQRNGIPSPLPSPIKESNHHQSSSVNLVREHEPDDAVASDWGQWREFFQNEYGVTINPNNVHERKKFMPLATAWVTANVSFGQMRAAIAKAYAEASQTIAYLPAYADRVLAGMSAPPLRRKIRDELDTKWNFAGLDRSNDIAMMNACMAYHGVSSEDTGVCLDFAGRPIE